MILKLYLKLLFTAINKAVRH